jgi:hypothetical protein
LWAPGSPKAIERRSVGETRALEKAHKLAPAGEWINPREAPSGKSTKTRWERKQETLARGGTATSSLRAMQAT